MANTITRTSELYNLQKSDNLKEYISEIETMLMKDDLVVNRAAISQMIGYIENGTCWKLAEEGV